MELQIPNTCDSFLETVGCCWHFKGEAKEIANVKGIKVGIADAGECKAFCRSVVETGAFKRRKISLVHVHVEIAAERFFKANKPEAPDTLDAIGDRLGQVLNDKTFESSTVACGFKIPAQQIAAGSALSSLFGLQGRLHSEHQTVLTRGTLSLMADGSDNELIDTLTFDLHTTDGKAYVSITVNGPGEDKFSPDCLVKAASRLTAVFNKLVLAKDESPKQAGTANG